MPVRPRGVIRSEHGGTQVAALKIDIEGYEDKALFPFFETAPQRLWPRHVLIEWIFSKNWERDCIAHLKALGYQERWRGPLNSILERIPS